MPEALKMVHLTPGQKRRKKFCHPLIDKAPPHLSDEQLKQLLLNYFEPGIEKTYHAEITEILIINYLRLLGGTIARYLYYWPLTRRFLDEMISTGVEAITKVIIELTLEKLAKRDLVNWIDGAIRFSIETTINDLRGIVTASRPTNFNREREKRKPVYGNIEAALTSDRAQDSKQYEDLTFLIFEIGDAFEVIARSKLERRILAEENWGLSHVELGQKLCTSSQHIGRLRNCLWDRYNKLGERYV
jgi:hypothetical protein